MNAIRLFSVVMALATIIGVGAAIGLCNEDSPQPYGIEQRNAWTQSNVVGSPEPPFPFVVEPAFPNINWDRPIYAKQEPGSRSLFVIQQGGEADKPALILRIDDRPDVQKTTSILEIAGRIVYGLEFHPDYAENDFVYLFSNGPTGQKERKNRISRYAVSNSLNAEKICDPNSELNIIEWRSMGHDGGDLAFGLDGMLYITSGDGTSDSDQWLSAQDVTNLRGGVLRIDVDHPTADRPYSIPPDNPFVDFENARGELWAIGLRNPWRMSIDPDSGHIWVGNNGQDLWETAHFVRRGDNFGWSVYEGSHPFYAHRELGPGNLVGPTLEHHHREARSLTGGIVYRGDRLPDLKGAYVYGDYSTGKIWAARHNGVTVTTQREIADTTLQIAGFSNTHQGELLVVDHSGGIYKLTVNPDSLRQDELPKFPRRLSETGLFESVLEHRVAPGVISYSVIAPGWNDGATVERFVALPNDSQIDYTRDRGWNFPNGAVLMQTLSVDCASDEGVEKRRIETRILTRQQNEWTGYSYEWNLEQDDAVLVDSSGKDIALNVTSSNSLPQEQTWRIPAWAECMSCHSRAVNYVLGMTELQMNRVHKYGEIIDSQLRTFDHIGLFSSGYSETRERNQLVDPLDTTATLEDRAKSYLHANCSGCHVEAGGGNSRMELEFRKTLGEMQIVSRFPQHNTFGILQPMIVAPGEPDRSVMIQRVTRRGSGQMPPLVSNRVDERGSGLLREWIASLQSDRKFVKEWTAAEILEQLNKPDQSRSAESGKQQFEKAGCIQCHRVGELGGGVGPNLTGIGQRATVPEIVESIVTPSAKISDAYASRVIVTLDGNVFQGRIEAETDEFITLRSNDSFSEPTKILKADIEEQSNSTVSSMPVGTINYLDLDEILDLITYLTRSGDRLTD